MRNGRTNGQCHQRWNNVLKPGLLKGSWTPEEDDIIRHAVVESVSGNIKWSKIGTSLPGRTGTQCRNRWMSKLDPSISKKEWTEEEDAILCAAQTRLGNRWAEIAKSLPGRTEKNVNNRFISLERAAARAQSKPREVDTTHSPPASKRRKRLP